MAKNLRIYIENIMYIQKSFYQNLYISGDCDIREQHVRGLFDKQNPYTNNTRQRKTRLIVNLSRE